MVFTKFQTIEPRLLQSPEAFVYFSFISAESGMALGIWIFRSHNFFCIPKQIFL